MTRELSPKAGAALLKKAFTDKNASLTHTEALDLIARLKGYEAWSHMQQVSAKAPQKPVVVASQPDKPAMLKKLALRELLDQHFGAWGQHPEHPREDWRYEVENNDTSLGYWEWVEQTLSAYDEYAGLWEFDVPAPVKVTLPDGSASTWAIECHLTDRSGELNYHAESRKPGLALLAMFTSMNGNLLERLREQMWDESTFVGRKDGKFGVYIEVEYQSRESEDAFIEGHTADGAEQQNAPHEVVVAQLLKGLQEVKQRFPTIEMCVPDASQIIWDRPAVWAFVPLDALNKKDMETLGKALMSL